MAVVLSPVLAPAVPWLPSDAGFLAWTSDPQVNGTTGTLATGVINLLRVNVRAGISCTNVLAWITAGGSSLTAGQNFAGLYNSAGTLVGTSADQTTPWAGTGLMTMPLTGGPFNLAAGFYWVALLSNASVTPATFARSTQAAAGTPNAGLAVSAARFAANGSGTTLPASITPASNTLTSLPYWAALS
jgi:hypothetical protein